MKRSIVVLAIFIVACFSSISWAADSSINAEQNQITTGGQVITIVNPTPEWVINANVPDLFSTSYRVIAQPADARMDNSVDQVAVIAIGGQQSSKNNEIAGADASAGTRQVAVQAAIGVGGHGYLGVQNGTSTSSSSSSVSMRVN